MKKQILRTILLFLLVGKNTILETRSPHRPAEPNIPYITTQWQGNDKTYTHKSFYYEEYPIFHVFNKQHFNQNKLPFDSIPYRMDSNKMVSGTFLANLIDQVLCEIEQGKKDYTHFTTLQSKNFNKKKKCGLIVLKFNDYPFVLKLFIETPKTFINPYCKGFEPRFFFMMGGGVNRHISGLTRIKNLELVKHKITTSTKWKTRVKTPRKWFWAPQNEKWIHVTGINIGNQKKITTQFPGTYAVIADAITDKNMPISQRKKNKIIMELCNDLDAIIDPHTDNFIFEYDKKRKDFSIVIIDTEHFPTMVGFKEKKTFRNHSLWYLHLSKKCFCNGYLRTKNQRYDLQKNPYIPLY